MDTEKLKGLAGSASRLVATSAQLAKKQAELAALNNVTLPKLYYLVGKRVARLADLPPELAPFRERIKSLEDSVTKSQETTHSTPEETVSGFAAKAKQVAQQVAQKASQATANASAQVQIQAAYVACGKEAVQRFGLKAIPKELQADWTAANDQIEKLSSEIVELQAKNSVGSFTPRRLVFAGGSIAGILLSLFLLRSVGSFLFGGAPTDVNQYASAEETEGPSGSAESIAAQSDLLEPLPAAHKEQMRLQEQYVHWRKKLADATDAMDREAAQRGVDRSIKLLGEHNAARAAGIDTVDGIMRDEHAQSINGKTVKNADVDRHVRQLKDRAAKDPYSIVCDEVKQKLGLLQASRGPKKSKPATNAAATASSGVGGRNGSQAPSKKAVTPAQATTPPIAADINLNFLLQTAIVRAFGKESQKFTDDSFKGIKLGDGHDDEPGKSNAPFDAPHWLSVPPHRAIENNGRPESTRVFVEKKSNRVVMVSAVYDGTSLDNLLPDILELFGKTPQEIVTSEWEQNRGTASSATLRYTFPRTIVRVKGLSFSRPFPRSTTQVWVYDRGFVEKSLLAYGESIVEACKWLLQMRDIAQTGHVELGEAVPIKGCEIRDWNPEDGQLLLYVDSSREDASRSVREAASKKNEFPRGLGQGGVLQPFDVALVGLSSRGQQLVACPLASSSWSVPELKSYHPHLEGSIFRASMIEDIVLTFASSVVQELFPPEGEEITIISRTSDLFWPPDDTAPIDRRKLQIISRSEGDRNEWVDQRGWTVQVSARGGISLTRRKNRGL